MKTRVVNVRNEAAEVWVGRPSVWGNPFRIGRDGKREDVIAKYETWLRAKPELLAQLSTVRGKVLGCMCSPLPCHGDVIAKLADEVVDAPAAPARVASPEQLERLRAAREEERAADADIAALVAGTEKASA